MVYIPPGRRGAVFAAASAAVVCLGAFAAFGPGGGTDPGYVAIGSAGASPDVTANIPPGGGVDLVPLDGGDGGSAGDGSDAGVGSTASSTRRPPSRVQQPTVTPTAPPTRAASTPTATPTATPSTSATSSTTLTPAHLTVSEPVRAASDVRWCEYVTVTFANTGDKAATSGTVTFGTHIIGLLGIDWTTIDTTKPVPVPVKGGAKKEKTWEICVDAWRVPLGMHIETRDVSLG